MKLSRFNPLTWYLMFACFALFSVAYTPVPVLAAFRAIQIIVAILLVLWLNPSLSNMNAFLRLFLLANVLAYFMLPTPVLRHQSAVFRFCTMICPQANACGTLFAMGAALSLAYSDRTTRFRQSIWFAVFAVLTLMTGSRTAIVALVGVSLLTMPFAPRSQAVSLLAMVGGALLVLASPEASTTISEQFVRGDVSDVYSLTGRLDIWKDALSRWWQSPIWGGGYYCTRAESYGRYAHCDSMFLDALVQTGAIGSLLLSGFWAMLGLRCFRQNWRFDLTYAAVVLPLFLYSLTGVTFAGDASLSTVVGLCIAVRGTEPGPRASCGRALTGTITGS